jgi:hypothetical protein
VAKAFVTLGGRIYEHSSADEFCDDPRAVKVGSHTVRCEDVVIATHNPMVGLSGLAGATLFQTKLALYTTYVVAGRVRSGAVPDALWWDTGDPYDYLRVEPHRDSDVIVFGGEDHKTGQQEDTAGCYQRLEERLNAIVPRVDMTHRWSGQVIETPDGLPYIGQTMDHQYAATGYAGNGLTFGTLDHRTGRRQGRRVSRSVRGSDAPLRDLHPYGVRGGVEHRRSDLGLPLSWLAVQANRRGHLRASRSAAVEGGLNPGCDHRPRSTVTARQDAAHHPFASCWFDSKKPRHR